MNSFQYRAFIATCGITVFAVFAASYYAVDYHQNIAGKDRPESVAASNGDGVGAAQARPFNPNQVATKVVSKENHEEGKKLYNANCLACHQPEGVGKIGLAPSIANHDFLAISSDDFIRKTVIAGRPGTAMVMRPDLAGKPLDKIIGYLRSLPTVQPKPILVDATKKHLGDAAKGASKYAVYCASCHGLKGQGYQAGGSGPGIGLPGFLSVASDDYIFKTVKHGRAGTPMRSFLGAAGLANLNPADVADIITHLRATSGSAAPTPVKVPVVTKADPANGHNLYNANCLACHQPKGAGKVGLAPNIANEDFLAVATDKFIEKTVMAGRPGTAMVMRPDLAGKPIRDITAYLRSLAVKPIEPVKLDDKKSLRGDPGKGSGKYAIYCASCHGTKGQGYLAGGAGPGIGLAGFLNVASDDFIYQTLKRGRAGTAMRPFMGPEGLANLSDEDVKDIISHLRAEKR